jgi:hypothetical protein
MNESQQPEPAEPRDARGGDYGKSAQILKAWRLPCVYERIVS